MASNDGARLLVFGLGMREHHNLRMQQLLRNFHRMPSQLDRPTLFTALFDLAKDLTPEQIQAIQPWMQNGGEFPLSVLTSAPTPAPAPVQAPTPSQAPAPTPTPARTLGTHTAPTRRPIIVHRDLGFQTQQVPGRGGMGRPLDGRDLGLQFQNAWNAHNASNFDRRYGSGQVLEPSAEAEQGHGSDQIVNPPAAAQQGFGPDHMTDPTFEAGPGQDFADAPRGFSDDEEDDDDDDEGNQPAYHAAPFNGRYGMGQRLEPQTGMDLDDISNERRLFGNGNQPAPLNTNPHDRNPRVERPRHRWLARGYEADLFHPYAPPQAAHPPTGRDTTHQEDEEDENEEEEPPRGLIHRLRRARGAFGRRRPAPVAAQQASSSSSGEPSSTDMECGICADTLPITSFPPTNKVTDSCNHDHDVRACFECLRKDISLKLKEGQLHLLTCPFCRELLSRGDLRKYATTQDFARYEELVMRDAADYVDCLGPKCGKGQKHENSEQNPIMICNSCGFKTCVGHKLPWHEGLTCEEFDMDESQIERLERDEATAKLLAKEQSRICSKCKQGVFRTDGCDHMTCRCGHEFCFICGASYENTLRHGESAHAIHCTYHPNRVQLRPDQIAAQKNQMTEVVHGQVSDALLQARQARNERVKAELRPLALLAAQRRAEQAEAVRKEVVAQEKAKEAKRKADALAAGKFWEDSPKRKVKLIAPWEEK